MDAQLSPDKPGMPVDVVMLLREPALSHFVSPWKHSTCHGQARTQVGNIPQSAGRVSATAPVS